MNVLALRRQGRTIKEIAAELGYHPDTVSRRLREGGAAAAGGGAEPAGRRRAMGGAHRRARRPAVAPSGHERVRDDPG